jgi:hypothetical protein
MICLRANRLLVTGDYMTTKSVRPVTRETSAFTRDRGFRAIIVTIEHGVIELRAKGLRSREVVDAGWLYEYAVKARVFSERQAKKAARKGGRK